MGLPRHTPIQPTQADLQELMQVAQIAANAAAEVTMRYFRQALSVENKAGEGDFDPVTIADREAELAIRAVFREKCPEIGVFGEEHDVLESESGLMWVVDPIDGTRSFMSGMPLWGTLIGLYNGEEAILGLADQPALGERFSAFSGRATIESPRQNGVLTTRRHVPLSKAIAFSTTPDVFTQDTGRVQFENIRDSARLMRYGGDCYAFALLASGHIDIVIDCDLKPYDIAALIPIIRGAGGVVTTWSGENPIDGGHIVASGSIDLHDDLLEKLSAFTA